MGLAPGAQARIHDGFEDSISAIWDQRLLADGAAKIQGRIVRAGKGALMVSIKPRDLFSPATPGSMASERDEIKERIDLWSKEGIPYRYAFSIFLPGDFPILPTRLVLAQWKQCDEHEAVAFNNPVLALRYVSGELRITLQTSAPSRRITIFSTKEEIRGKWLDFVFMLRFSRKGDGRAIALMNGKEIANHSGATAYSEEQNYPPNGRFYFKMGLYRDCTEEPMSVYLNEFSKEELEVLPASSSCYDEQQRGT